MCDGLLSKYLEWCIAVACGERMLNLKIILDHFKTWFVIICEGLCKQFKSDCIL